MLLSKKELRRELLARRRALDKAYRKEWDMLVYNKLTELPEILAADTILTYISTEIEVDTIAFIGKMIKSGKTIAVPKCEGKEMRFIKISGFDDLEKGAFGILEPKDGAEITDFKGSVCITPALSYDEKGFRMGYGGGFYDRFSLKYDGISVGICYESFMGEIPAEEFDKPVHIIVTDKKIRYIN